MVNKYDIFSITSQNLYEYFCSTSNVDPCKMLQTRKTTLAVNGIIVINSDKARNLQRQIEESANNHKIYDNNSQTTRRLDKYISRPELLETI